MAGAIELVDVVKDFPVGRRLRHILLDPFHHPRQRVLHGVSLTVDPGEIVVMLGPNGSGKSTCLHLLAGLLRPESGRVRVLGVDVSAEAERARSTLGFVSANDRGFYARLSVGENLRFFAALQGLHGEACLRRMAELAHDFDYEGLTDQPFRFLSAGQRARVALARALLHRPSVLLLDEVTRSLDPGTARRFRQRIVNDLVRDQQIAVLYTSHDLAEAEQIASRVVVLDEGRVVSEGRWSDVQPALEATFFAEESA